MTTQFCSEHVFRAPSVAAVFDAYFDPAHQLVQDRLLEVVERTVLELIDDGATLRRVCKIVPRRQLPAIVRRFVSQPLHYIETATWHRADDRIDIASMLSITKQPGPAISGVYRLSRVSDGAISRSYKGIVSVDIALIASKIERGIVAEFDRSMPIAATSTQAWLDRAGQEVWSLSPQA